MRSDSRERDLAEARFGEVVFPHHCNHLGSLFGGEAYRVLAPAAIAPIGRNSRQKPVVTPH
ncbi:MAG: hypothetical protein ABI082_16000 [Dokdonella sp.]